MITPRQPVLALHPLLNHHPLPVLGQDEAVKIKLEAVLHGRAVDLGDEAARLHQGWSVESDALRNTGKLLWRLSRMPAAPAAHIKPEVLL